MAVAFTAIGVVATIAAAFDPAPSKGLSLLSLIGFYFLAGISGGLLLGLLRPLTVYRAGAMFVATLLVALSLSLLDFAYVIEDHWKLVDTILVAFGSLVGGPVVTLMIWQGRSRMGKVSSGVPDSEPR
jgi:hypothetical protein